MRILLVTDAWKPQVNGVVQSLSRIIDELNLLGCEVERVSPEIFWNIACPTYDEIRLALGSRNYLEHKILKENFDAIHIATEGPLGMTARAICLKHNFPFTTAYHTRFPEYIHTRFGVPVAWSLRAMRWFHSAARRTMVATKSLERELSGYGFKNLSLWSRGVDTRLFRPRAKKDISDAQPIQLYVGRIAPEKNLESFLSLTNLPGTKWVVGEGPELKRLQSEFPEVRFFGKRQGQELAEIYSQADVFVFPSRTDTFGLVLLEALASGLPVAAYPVAGLLDVLGSSGAGALNHNLEQAIVEALEISPGLCRQYALEFSWRESAVEFRKNLFPIVRRLNLPRARAPFQKIRHLE